MDIASLIILGKALLGLGKIKDPCAHLKVGSQAHFNCLRRKDP